MLATNAFTRSRLTFISEISVIQYRKEAGQLNRLERNIPAAIMTAGVKKFK